MEPKKIAELINPSGLTWESKITKKRYDTEKIKELVVEKAKLDIRGFKLSSWDARAFDLLLYYFCGDERFLKQGYDPYKGILLTGSIGVGKTSMINMINGILSGFRIISTTLIVDKYEMEGTEVKLRYGVSYIGYKPITFCFDDLGFEPMVAANYANKTNVMADILSYRYIEYEKNGMITHATTNLSISKLKECYGDRIIDRFKKMFNHIIITGKSLR